MLQDNEKSALLSDILEQQAEEAKRTQEARKASVDELNRLKRRKQALMQKIKEWEKKGKDTTEPKAELSEIVKQLAKAKTATSEQANDAIKSIRDKICQIYGQMVGNGVIIQYGGSVKSTNAKELFEMSDIDGGLVGGASLKPDEFAKIVTSV